MTEVIDTHTHWTPSALIEVLERREEFPRIIKQADGSRLIEYSPGNPHPFGDEMWDERVKLAKMDAGGIDLSVISVVGGISVVDMVDAADAVAVARAANDELVDLCHRHPTRFAALAALPLRTGPDAAIAELERAMSLGLKGAMVYSNVRGRMLDDAEFMPVWEAAAKLGAAIQIHPTHPLAADWLRTDILITGIGFLFDTTTAALRLILAGVYEKSPDLKLQLCHIGSLLPYILGRLDYQAHMFPHEVSHLSAPPSEYARKLYTDSVCLYPPALRLCLDVYGPDHLMWGTDDPFWPVDGAFATLAALNLPAEEYELITAGTARHVFGL